MGRCVVYSGHTWHERFQPKRHSFDYPFYFLGIDLDELRSLQRSSFFFGYNSFRPIGIWDCDYLTADREPLDKKVRDLIASRYPCVSIERVMLLTVPRLLGYVFNPVSFYLCYGFGGALDVVIAEVNNTFDEKHVYPLIRETSSSVDGSLSFRFPKAFYVSPFLDTDGDYELQVRLDNECVTIVVNLEKNGDRIFTAGMSGEAQPVTTAALVKLSFQLLYTGWLTMIKIYWQAFHLHFRKKLKIFRKVEPDNPTTIPPTKRGFWSSMRLAIVNFLSEERNV